MESLARPAGASAAGQIELASTPLARPLPPFHRLVVLVPDMDLDETRLAHYIWSLASPCYLDVLFLSLYRDAEAELRARRRLAILAAITRDDRIRVESRVYPASKWEKAIRAVWQPGDIVLCHAEQTDAVRELRRTPSATTPKFPLVVLYGFSQPEDGPWRKPTARWASWLVPLVIIVSFALFQIRLERVVSENGMRTLLLCASVTLEFGLIWLSHRFLN